MLVTQQCDTGRHIWSSSKLGAFHQNPASPRMSSREQLKTQQDWREHYSQFLPSHESTLLPCFDQVTGFEGIESSSSERQFAGRSQLEHRHNVATLDNRRDVTEIITINRPGSAPGNFEEKASNGLGQDSISPAKSTAQLLTLAPLSSTSPSVKGRTDTSAGLRRDLNTVVDAKEVEDEDDDEDDQMLDPEDGSGPPQTEAERRAERRKMKRFRLTHQQTRFLMSEFAKQAHPDAAHRERLSREIPGLSPRQVQVWFQNRRAKIKRLTADDRDRMLIMRAVPDGFDNVQALHSPYGAVQGIGTPLQSPIDYASYGEQVVMRPLLVDTIRRQEIEEQHLSPTGLSPSFGHAGFAPPGSISTSDVLSPLNSGDRFYGSHQSSPLSAGPRTANSFNLQTSSDAYKIHQHPRHPRLLQPLQLRDTMSRTRSQSLQSPLRTSMSWKGETLDYAGYQTGAASPTNTRRHQPQYQPDQAGINPGSSHHFDTNPYPDSTYSSQPTPLQSPATTAPRIRSASTAFPSGLDLHNEYRTPNNQQMGPPGAPPTPHATTFSNPFAVNSSGFASAPLSAPSDFQLPRTPIDVGQRDYHMSQLSAPMAPPQDFRSAYNQVLSPVRPTQTEGTFNTQQPQQHSTGASVQAQSAETPVFLPIDTDRTRLGHRRKRTFSMPLQFDGL